MDDLIEFLRARLAEDEAVARAAADGDGGEWFVGDKWGVYRAEDAAPHDDVEENRLVVHGNVLPQSEHIARHDPARALREVEAKRRVIERYAEAAAEAAQTDRIAARTWRPVVIVLEPVVKDLTQAYTSHPDYRSEWAPDA